MLLKKSTKRSCATRSGNNRIRANGFLNRCCSLDAHLESMLLRAPLKIPFSTVSTQSGHRADRIPAVCYAVIAAIGATHDRCVGARAFHGVRHGMGDPVAPYPWIFSFGSGAGGPFPPGG